MITRYRNHGIMGIALGFLMFGLLVLLIVLRKSGLPDVIVVLGAILLAIGGIILYLRGCISLAEAKGHTGGGVTASIIMSVLLPGAILVLPIVLVLILEDKNKAPTRVPGPHHKDHHRAGLAYDPARWDGDDAPHSDCGRVRVAGPIRDLPTRTLVRPRIRCHERMKALLSIWLLLVPVVIVAQDYAKQFPLRQQTKYFDFRFKRNPERIKAIARFADGFIKVVNRDFFKADYDYPIRVLVLEDRATFQNFLRQQFGLSDPPGFGIFLYQHNLFATYEDSGLGTFAHEIIHPLVERNLKHRPVWAVEGVPAFFEKFYGYWQNDDLVLNWGYQNPWRIAGLGTNLVRLNLKEILSTTETPGRYHESDRRLVSVFLWEQGKFKPFLQLIKMGEKNGYDSSFEAAMGMPLDRIMPLWQSYLNKVVARKSQMLRLPLSTVLPGEQAFEKFVALHDIPVLAEDKAGSPPAK